MVFGALLILYIVPFWIWQLVRHFDIERRKKLYPGREQEKQDEERFESISLRWCIGLVAMLALWKITS